MDKRNLGLIILVLSLLMGIAVVNLISNSRTSADEKGCFNDSQCGAIASTLSISHLGIGILFALFSLGVYLMIFGRTEERLLQQLEQQREHLTREEKLRILALLLSENEQKVFQTVVENEGITQNTLRIKTDLSKAMLSKILSDFERKKIVVREARGKTYAVYVKPSF